MGAMIDHDQGVVRLADFQFSDCGQLHSLMNIKENAKKLLSVSGQMYFAGGGECCESCVHVSHAFLRIIMTGAENHQGVM
jgi:hypothetical protein